MSKVESGQSHHIPRATLRTCRLADIADLDDAAKRVQDTLGLPSYLLDSRKLLSPDGVLALALALPVWAIARKSRLVPFAGLRTLDLLQATLTPETEIPVMVIASASREIRQSIALASSVLAGLVLNPVRSAEHIRWWVAALESGRAEAIQTGDVGLEALVEDPMTHSTGLSQLTGLHVNTLSYLPKGRKAH